MLGVLLNYKTGIPYPHLVPFTRTMGRVSSFSQQQKYQFQKLRSLLLLYCIAKGGHHGIKYDTNECALRNQPKKIKGMPH